MTYAGIVAVFWSSFFADVLWAYYALHVTGRRPVLAATMAAGIIAFGAIAVKAYVDQPTYVIPAALGAAMGTYTVVRWAKR